MRNVRYIILLLLALPVLISVIAAPRIERPSPRPRHRVVIAPAIPKAKRTPQLVFLEHADELRRSEGDPYLVLVGNVRFSKGGMMMYTDSAHYYDETGSFNAFGNVRMEQGDTLFVYADELNYDGPTEVAVLFGFNGNNVRLINREVKLETDIFTYDMAVEVGSYTTGGVLTDRDNRLESIEGEYSPATKEANFYDNVVLTSKRPDDELRMVGNALYYNTATHVAEFNTPTVITSKDGRIDSDEGIYNTETRISELFAHSLVTTARGSTLEGDTLYYDRIAGYGEAFGNMVLTDTIKKSILKGDYGFYNEIQDSAFVTGHALGMEFSQGDTLYIHGRYLRSTRLITLKEIQKADSTATDSTPAVMPAESMSVDTTLANVVIADAPTLASETDTTNIATIADTTVTTPTARPVSVEMAPDTTHIITAWPRVRFYRFDMQGICDSLVFTQCDTTVRLYYHPIVWSEDRQIFGNRIDVHLNDSTVDRADLPDFGFMAQAIEKDFYNQLAGKTMTAWFVNGEMDRALVSGNVEGIVYPEENDSTINKLVSFQTANLEGWFEKQNIRRLKMWPETQGEAIPLYLVKYSQLFLPKFQWYTGIRPTTPKSVMTIPPEMEQLMSDRPISAADEALQLVATRRNESSDTATPSEAPDSPEQAETPTPNETTVAPAPDKETDTHDTAKPTL